VAAACAATTSLPPRSNVLPSVPRPAIVTREDKPEPLPQSRLMVPLETDLSSYEPLLAEVLREHLVLYQDSWTKVSQPKANPEVETRMEARLDAPTLRIEGQSVHVEVPIRYWGELRSKARTPFGSLWLTRGTHWGNARNPGKITLAVSVKPEIDKAWRLRTKSKLDSLTLTAPRFETLCTTTGVRICLARAQAEKLVHTVLEGELRRRIALMLSALDQRIQQRIDLRTAVEMGFRALSTPAGKEQLWLAIDGMGMTALHGQNQMAQLDLELLFRPSWQDRRGRRPTLPARGNPSKRENNIDFDLELHFAELSTALTQASAGTKLGAFDVTRFEALGPGNADGLILALTASNAQATHTVYLNAQPRADQGWLRFEQLTLSKPSLALLSELDIDAQPLLAELEKRAQLPLLPLAQRRLGDLQNRLALLTLAFGAVSLELTEPTFGAVGFARDALSLRVSSRVRAQVVR
jgi:hypothetical protein